MTRFRVVPVSVPGSAPDGFDAKSAIEEFSKLRDPFVMPEIHSESKTPKTELEHFSVSEYKLIGVLTGPNHLRALVLSPDGKTHIAVEKAKIGLKGGIIRKITQDTLYVREKVMNVLGSEEAVDSLLQLPTENKTQDATQTSTPESLSVGPK